jgi:hypothetical protein
VIDGKIVSETEIQISKLLSPKRQIDISTAEKAGRFSTTLERTRSGSPPPPITVTPGSKGTPIKEVTFGTDH